MMITLILTFVSTVMSSLPDRCVENGMIAITFDDGPTPYTKNILDQLEDLGVPATFHFTVQNASRGEIANIMRRAIDEGHTVGLRVNPKRNYDQMDTDAIKSDLKGQINVLQSEIDQKIRFARAPTLDGINEDVYEALKKSNIAQTGYSYCFYYDAQDEDEAVSQLEKILETSSPQYESFIFLLHDEKESEFPLLKDIVKKGKAKGYKFVNYDECFEGYEPGETIVYGGSGGGSGSSLKDTSGASPILAVPLLLLCYMFI